MAAVAAAAAAAATAVDEDQVNPAFDRMNISSFEIDTVDAERVEAEKAAKAAAKKAARFRKQGSTTTSTPGDGGEGGGGGDQASGSSPKPQTSAGGGESSPLDRQMSVAQPFKVMIAVDPNRWSAFAFDWYVKNAHQQDSEVICYHTMDKPAVHGDENVDAFEAVMKGCESNAQDLHSEYTKKMEEHKVNGRVVIQFSVIGTGEAIVEAAHKERVQMIVVGSRGKGVVRRKLMGSVSDHVLLHVRCPVIVCCQDRPRRRSSRLSSSNSFSEEEIV